MISKKFYEECFKLESASWAIWSLTILYKCFQIEVLAEKFDLQSPRNTVFKSGITAQKFYLSQLKYKTLLLVLPFLSSQSSSNWC